MPDSSTDKITPLPALRAPTTGIPANVGNTDTPLPTLHTAALGGSTMSEKDAPSLTELCIARAPTPLEDENTVITAHSPYEGTAGDMNAHEGSERIQNPVNSRSFSASADVLTGDSSSRTVPGPSSQRPMHDQTMRSFETRKAASSSGVSATQPTPYAAASALTRTSSVVVTLDDVAPSEVEIYQQGGLLPAVKGEKVPQHRERTDENELRICTHIVTINRRIAELEQKTLAQHSEVLTRLQDVLRQGSPVASTFVSDLTRLRSLTLEGRAAIGGLTEAVNKLVDLPRDVEKLARMLRDFPSHPATPPAPMTSSAHPDDDNYPGSPSKKRDTPFDGFNDPTTSPKRPKVDPTYTDIYLWPVDTTNVSPAKIAHTALERLGLRTSGNPFVSVQHPRNLPKTVISLRFRNEDFAERFVDTLRSSAPESMKSLHAAKPAVYEKRATSGGDKQRDPCLRIVVWNINGRLAVKITQPDIVALINDNDVVIFQETFLRVGEERTLELPLGFEIIAMSRPDLPGLRSAWGGVAAVVRSTVPYKLLTHLCAPDILVLDLMHLFLIGAYILPPNSQWREYTDTNPEIKLAEAVTVCSSVPDKPVMCGGDLNGRIGHRIPTGAILGRFSADDVVNTRGRWILRLCSDTAMTILNGTTKESANRGAFTSFQPLGSSVIDYCFVSAGLVPRIKDGALRVVKSPIWSDHAQVRVVVVNPEVTVQELRTRTAPRPSPIVFKEPTPLDLLLKATLEAGVSSEEATSRLYGPVYAQSGTVSVYVGTSVHRGRASFALWWGRDSVKNCSFVLEDKCTDSAATILAVLCAAQLCPRNKSLAIYTSSEYVIRSFCYWAGDNETRGWSCANGDELRDATEWLAYRHAPTDFRWVSAKSGNESVLAAKAGAAAAVSASSPAHFIYTLPVDLDGDAELAIISGVRKVSTQLCEVPEAKPRALPEVDVEDVIDPDVSHRGRRREREIMRENLLKLLACTGKSSKDFWELVRSWTDDKPTRPHVTLGQLHDSFKARLNPPDEIPDFFDADLHKIVTALNDTIPRRTIDRTPQAFFSRRITMKDIQEIKKRLRNKSFRSANGIDSVSYAKIMSIPNEALITLFHACLDNVDAPQQWLVTLLIGILKQGRTVDDPESYRLVGLECCLLKVLTLLLDGRLREWAAANKIIPDSQNGFQPDHRTDDNSFILLCAIHRARAEGKTLYVFFGDMTNAFPYTDVGRLWTDMYSAGVSGPFFDLMRLIYARMAYAVKFGNEYSLPFRSIIGLLTGDSASPTLWNIYFSDFRLPPHPDDIHLNGRPVSQAEQADDNLVMSTSFPPFQAKVTMFFKWCANKRVFISAKKSKWMIFGPLPAIIPVLRLGDLIVELVHEFKYVGIWFSSVHANVLARHYAVKASKARGTSSAIFGLKHRVGSLPIREALILYTARVDCYLISGCELALDTDNSLLREHLEVQHQFLRRLLGLNSHSMLAVLFTETGQMPVRIRRLLLALGRLQYMVGLNPNRVVHSALLDSIALLRVGKSGWASDLTIMLQRLPTAIEVSPDELLSAKSIEALVKKIVTVVDADLQRDIDNLVKTHMLRNRLEPGEDKTLRLVTRRLRHYLVLVAVPAHRKAMTGLLLGDHNLSVERLRYPARYRNAVPREHRLCRFCRRAVEDEVHALFDCSADFRLVDLRTDFLDSLLNCDPVAHALSVSHSSYEFMIKLVSSRKAVKLFAKYIYQVLNIFDGTPRYFPLVFRSPGQ